MEWSLDGKHERVGPVEVEDIRKDLLRDFSALPTQQSVQSQPENLQVFLRIRPFTTAESDSGEAQDCVTMEGLDSVTLKAPKSMKSQTQTAQRFTFTQVFGPGSSQRTVFEGSVRPLVRDVLEGGNCLVFTYGVTNAGKTFTFLGPDHDSGLLPRSLSVIFNSLENRLYSGCDLKPQRCRDYSRLSPEQQSLEIATKRTLLRTHKESDKSLTSGRSTFLDGSALTDSSLSSVSDTDAFSLDVDSSVRFSVWVSFCEIYNDNIHDLLELVPNGHQRRTVLRLSQDVKGNSFIKDLRWVQVKNFEEAYRILKIGKKNQSFSSTRLNLLSSRSHSIFSVRILRIYDVGVPRVLGISELSLCDLAGSERCSRTQNTGDRLKEAGNINSSLLTLGKCISAMRFNQHAKFQHHVPFRESKLTHFLQFFFCGAGRVTMVVNINQNPSCFDETLNVLKFSALAQKVVVLSTRPQPLEPAPQRSAMELSMILDEAASRRLRGRRSSLVAWDTSLEDVLETEGEWVLGEEEEEEDEEEGTVLEAADGEDTTVEEGLQGGVSQSDTALRLVVEAQIREEVSAEFMELFNKMEKDFSERLEKEREILEERAEKRVEILKNLMSRTVDMSALSSQDQQDPGGGAGLEGLISSMSEDVKGIREYAQRFHRCLTEPHSAELEALRQDQQQSLEQLQAAQQRLEQQQEQLSDLTELCQQKDHAINKLTSAFNRTVEDCSKQHSVVESIRSELMLLQQNCSCLRKQGNEEGKEPGERKRQRDSTEDESAPAKKRGLLEDEIWRLQEENELKEQLITELRLKQTSQDQDRTSLDQDRTSLDQDRIRLQEEVEKLRKENTELENRIQQLTVEVVSCPHCVSVLLSLESEQKETSRLNKENKALVNGMFQLQNQVTDLQKQLHFQTDRSDSLSDELNSTKSRLQSQSDEREQTIHDMSQELDRLRQEAKEEGVFHDAMDRLKQESEAALRKSAQQTRQVQDLQEKLQASERLCAELREESSNRRAEFERLEAGLKEECGSLKQKLEEMERSAKEERREMEKQKHDLLEAVSLREQTLVESQRQTEELRAELQHLKEHLQNPTEEEEEEEKENQELRKVTVVEELREELNKLQQRKNREQNRDPEPRPTEDQRMEAVTREVERFRELQNQSDVQRVSPVKTTSDRRKTPRTTGHKRKSCEVMVLDSSENKRNRTRAKLQKQTSSLRPDRPLQKLGDFIHKSPSILSSTAKGLVDLVVDSSRTTGSKQRRGRRKLYKPATSSPMIDSPDPQVSGGPFEEKESDHLKIKRQLRSKTCRK